MKRFTRRTIVGAATAVASGWQSGFAEAQTAEAPEAAFTSLLTRYVSQPSDGVNRVDYARWHANGVDLRRLDGVISAWSALAPSRMAHWEVIAYWANLYNAVTLQVVLRRYPVASIRDIRSEGVLDPRALIGPWRTKLVTVERRRLSLDDIENRTLRPLARDPRIHYSINCASIGCPNLQVTAWRADTMTQELDQAARAYVNHPRGVTALGDGSLRASSIYDWFKQDFGGNDAGVIAHLSRFAEPALVQRLRSQTRIGSYAYDWALNGAT